HRPRHFRTMRSLVPTNWAICCLLHSGCSWALNRSRARITMKGTGNMFRLVGPLTKSHPQAEGVLAVQLLLQLLVTDRSHLILLSSASRSHCASRAPAS